MPIDEREKIRAVAKGVYLLPFDDLHIEEADALNLKVMGQLQLGLVLPYGMGPTQPRVFRVTDAGALKVDPGTVQATVSGTVNQGVAQALGASGWQTTEVEPFSPYSPSVRERFGSWDDPGRYDFPDSGFRDGARDMIGSR